MIRVVKDRKGVNVVERARGKALDAVKNYEFKDGRTLTAKDLNRILYAIRALDRRTKRGLK